MLHLRVGLVLTALGLMVACGDDDDNPDASTSTSDAAVGAAPGSGKAGSGGGVMLRDAGMSAVRAGTGGSDDTPTGTIEENNPCNAANPCAPDLACVTTGVEGLSVCARPCGQAGDAATTCEAEEVCGSYTNLARDRHCINLVDKAWDPCGAFETADCAEPLACARLADDPETPQIEVIQYCVLPCTPTGDPDADAGIADLEMSTCPAGDVCLPNSGICVTLVDRGGECRLGFFCEDEAADACLPDRTSDFANATFRCQQDCEEPGTVCETGECVTASDSSGAMASWCLDEN